MLGIEHDLGQAFTVAQINKYNSSVITPHVNPTRQTDGLSDLRRAQFTAVVCTFHDCSLPVFAFTRVMRSETFTFCWVLLPSAFNMT